MKVTNFILVTCFLAVASLGSAFPPTPKSSTEVLPHKVNGTAKTDSASKVQTTVLDAANAASPIGNISPNCQMAILSIIINPEFLECVSIQAFNTIYPIITDPSFLQEFLKDPAKDYLKLEQLLIQFVTALCVEQKCSDEFDAAAIKDIQDGCKDELESNPLIQILFGVFVFYSPLRDIVCFKDKDQFCFDQTALTLIKLPPSPIKIIDGGFIDSIAVSDPTAICTECNNDIVNTIFNFLKAKKDQKDPIPFAILAKLGITDQKIDLAKTGAIVKCGLQFVDGSIEL